MFLDSCGEKYVRFARMFPTAETLGLRTTKRRGPALGTWRTAWVLCGVAAGLLLATSTGCQPTQSKLADRAADLPMAAHLPPGFYPLTGHAAQGNPDDCYNGWPRYIVCENDNMVMAYVPTQTITMGGGLGRDEVPARKVVINHFYADIHEVTNVQFDRFRKAAAERKPCAKVLDPMGLVTRSQLAKNRQKDRPWEESEAYHTYEYEYACREQGKQMLYPETSLNYWLWNGQTPADIDFYLDYWKPGLNNNHPARNVSWWEAWYYSKWVGKTLPTEAQWEAAARGTDQRIFPWGNDDVSETTRYLCNAKTDRESFDGYEYTAPVLNFAAGVSPHGLYNMAGNVWEWCADWYDPGRYAYPSDEDPAMGMERGTKAFGDANYPNPLGKDIREGRVGPLRGDERAIRGGSFADPIDRCRVDARTSARPDVHRNNVGFRCVLPLPPEDMLPSACPKAASCPKATRCNPACCVR